MENIEKRPKVKKNRCQNWLQEEKVLLKTVVRRHIKEVENKNTDSNTNKKKKEAWQQICASFNKLGTGPYRTTEQLKTQWSVIKMMAKKKRNEELQAGGRSRSLDGSVKEDDIECWLAPELFVDTNELDSDSFTQPEHSNASSSEPMDRNKVFATVRQACIDLANGHSISLIDEEAFRTLIQLMPMTLKEKAMITSEYIQKCIDSIEEADDMDMLDQVDRDAGDRNNETTNDRVSVVAIKAEIEEVQCNCDPPVTEDSTRGHEMGCPAAAKQPYWQYFEVSSDEAICQICSLTFNWTNITKLKEHLLDKHPTAEFVDDGEGYARGLTSDAWSLQDTEEVYLEDDFDADSLPAPSASKRKRTSEHLNAADEGTPRGDKNHIENKFSQKKVKAEKLKAMKEERPGLSEASRRVIEQDPVWFLSLDTFGQYVAGLMKLIPKEKCPKLQVQIVQRLLQEQAAAG